MKKLNLTLASVWSVSVLLGCANRTSSPTVVPDQGPVAVAAVEPAQTKYLSVDPAQATPAAATQPSDKAALPAGHPAIPSQGAGAGQLPAGHPPMPVQGGQQQLPAGHPPMPQGQGGTQGLPAGHPTMEQMQATAAPSTQPAFVGTLTVKAVQKTAGGPAISGDPVTVEVYNQDNMVNKLEAKLDDKGIAAIPNVPFGGSYGQFVRVNHGGVEYTAQPDEPKADARGQEVEVGVYEATEQAPKWHVKMRHMLVNPGDKGGVVVTDVLAVENPSDKAWIGTADASGKRATFSVNLPAGATDVQLGGAFHECCVKVENGKATNSMALVPGVMKYQLNYNLPAVSGKAELTATMPALVKNMIIMLPDDGSAASAEGLEGPSTVNMGNGNTRFFRGQELAAGTTVKVSVAASATAVSGAKKPVSSTSSLDSSQAAKVIAGAGGLVIFVVGGALMFLRAPKTGKKSK